MSHCRTEEIGAFILKTIQPYFQLPVRPQFLGHPGLSRTGASAHSLWALTSCPGVTHGNVGKATRVPEVLGTARLEISPGFMAKGAASHLIPHVFEFLHTCFLPRFKVHSLAGRAGKPHGRVSVGDGPPLSLPDGCAARGSPGLALFPRTC